MGPQARVLIVAADDTLAGSLSEGLDRFGWTTATARGPQSALAVLSDFPIEAAVVDVERLDPDVASLGALLKSAAHPRRIPVIAVGSPLLPLDPDAYDMVLAPPLHAPQIAMRIEQLVRAAVAEEEFELRAQTFQDRGARLERPREPEDPIRVMAVGSPAPKFLALSNALQASGVETIGAFTAYTAFDYLHERPFDAVVLWGDDEAEAKAIAAGMRRNTRLFHIPTILYMSSESELDRAEAFDRGVTDMAAPDVPESETARRVLALARTYRRQSAVRRALENARGSGLMDSATGLFTRDLFAAHLARLASASRERNRRLSVCVLKVAESADVARVRETGKLDRAMPQIGSMISRLVRAEDTAARLGPELFALALPATAEGAARLVAERIGAVVGCTAFDAGEGRQPFVVEFDIGVAELGRGETAIATLERAAEAARSKTRAAS